MGGYYIHVMLINQSSKTQTKIELYYSQVVTVHDVTSLYHVPSLLEEQNVSAFLIKRLGLPCNPQKSKLAQWRNLANK